MSNYEVIIIGGGLTGAYALGPEPDEWQPGATFAIRVRVPLALLRDTIQPLRTFLEGFVEALHALCITLRKAAVAR